MRFINIIEDAIFDSEPFLFGNLFAAGSTVETVSSFGNQGLSSKVLSCAGAGRVLYAYVDMPPDNDAAVEIYNDLCELRLKGVLVYPVPVVNAEYYYLHMVKDKISIPDYLLQGNVTTKFEQTYKRTVSSLQKCLDNRYFRRVGPCPNCVHPEWKSPYAERAKSYVQIWRKHGVYMPSLASIHDKLQYFESVFRGTAKLQYPVNRRRKGIPDEVPDFIIDSCAGLSTCTIIDEWHRWQAG